MARTSEYISQCASRNGGSELIPYLLTMLKERCIYQMRRLLQGKYFLQAMLLAIPSEVTFSPFIPMECKALYAYILVLTGIYSISWTPWRTMSENCRGILIVAYFIFGFSYTLGSTGSQSSIYKTGHLRVDELYSARRYFRRRNSSSYTTGDATSRGSYSSCTDHLRLTL